MLFSLKKIAALAGTRQGYLRGVALYNAGAVSQLSSVADTDFAEHITAAVQERRTQVQYAVEVGLNAAGDAVMYTCDCASRESGACKHVIAALTHKYYRDMVNSFPAEAVVKPPEEDGVVRRMLDGYFHEAQTVIRAASGEQFSLIPTLHMNLPPILTLSLRREDGRCYAVKDLLQFRERFSRGEVAEYGGHLEVCHHAEAFEPESRPLLTLIRAVAPTIGRTRRELVLSPMALDRFVSLYIGKTVAVDDRPVAVVEDNPPITVAVEAADGGVTLIGRPPRTAMGEQRMYLVSGNTLFATTPAFTAARGLLAALRESDGCLALDERQTAAFVGSALPVLESVVAFTGDTAAFDCHRPRPLTAAIYLDRPEPMTLSARVEFRYGERVYLLGGEEDGELRDRLGEWRVQTVVLREFSARDTQNGLFFRECTDDTLYEFITDGLSALSRVAEIYMSDAFRGVRVVSPPRMAVGVRLQSGLLELDLQVSDIERSELSALMDSYRRRKRYHRLKSGAFLSLEEPSLRGFSRLWEGLGVPDRQLASGRITAPAYRALFVDRVLTESRALDYTRDDAVRALLKTVKSVEESEFVPPDTLVGTLRRYQRAGFSWLRTMENCGFGGILADDMGLGKTVQMIALLLDARARGITKPSLVVCPASLILNWENEIRRFAPSLTVRAVMGDSGKREAIVREIRAGDVVVTSYDLLKRDLALYSEIQFHYHVLDEAQYIKNHATQNARAVKSIRSVQRFALTGTPVENRLGELWSIFDFLMPGFLFSYRRFSERFEKPAVRDGDCEALDSLSRLCAPFILRRLKKDVLQELPPKTEAVHCVPMEDLQRRTYLAAALRMSEELKNRQQGGQSRLQALTMLTRLRQICCDPSLCFENYRGGSAKLEACVELTCQAVAQGHRVLVFSQFTSMLAILKERFSREGIAYYLLEGATPKEKRAAMVEAFNISDDVPLFLISLKAGGTGLNLTAADVVIHYDPWWNSSVQNQATDRAHRIGQQRPVQVYTLITKGTVEEKLLHLQEKKQSLADAVVRADEFSLAALSNEELLELLAAPDEV